MTESLERTLLMIKSFFHGLEPEMKLDTCRWFIRLRPDGAQGAFGAWSIYPLAAAGYGDSESPSKNGFWTGSRACESSVTVRGGCYYAGAANYSMFGVMHRLCNDLPGQEKGQWSLTMTHQRVLAWKLFKHGRRPWDLDVKQAIAFTDYGYADMKAITAPSLPGCNPSKVKCRTWGFQWWWEPFKPMEELIRLQLLEAS